MAFIRELDYTTFYGHLAFVPHLKEVAAVLGLVGLVAWYRRQLPCQLRGFFARKPCLLFILGSVMVIAWAQTLGMRKVWKALYENTSQGKRMVEENLELAGYMLILFGVVEEFIALVRRTGAAPSNSAKEESVSTAGAMRAPGSTTDL